MILARNSITLSHVRDIISTTWYYRLQTSTASPPSKPDTETPAGWTTVEPSYTSGSTSSLYVTMQTVYSDGSFDYSDVSLSSSFEAAKEAYNKAAAAQSTAEQAQSDIDNLEIGGRNLLLNSSFSSSFEKWSASGHEIVVEDGMPCGHVAGVLSAIRTAEQSILEQIKDDSLTQLYTASAEIKLVNYTPGSTNPYLGLYVSGQYDNGGTGAFLGATYVGGTVQSSSNNLPPFNDQGWVHVTYIFRFARKPISMYFRIYSRDWEGDLYYRNVKLERGNRATDWTPAPEDAAADAARAQATADGKNTVYHTAAAPAGTDHSVGDVWFNTANGNEISIWDGTQWAASKLADDALDVLTVAKAIISYLDVGSLSAGDITALLAVFKKISSKDGRNYWNLETGLFHTEKGEFTGSVTGSTITGSSLQTTNGTTATFDYSTSNGGISNRGASSSADSHVTVSARGVKHYHSDDDSDEASIKAQVIPALMNGTEYGWYITPMAYIRKLFTDKGQVVCKPELNSVISALNTTIGQINTRVGGLLASSTPATGVSGVSGNVCGQTAMLYFANFSFTVSGSGNAVAVSTGQLNAAYYPARTLDLVDTLNGVRFTISTSGEIKASGALSATKAIRGTFTYIRANVSLGTNASTLTPVSYNYE